MAALIREALEEKAAGHRPRPRSLGIGDSGARIQLVEPLRNGQSLAYGADLRHWTSYASLDRRDAAHLACRRLIEAAEEPLIIPSPVLVEVDYWIHARLYSGVLVALLDDIGIGAYQVENLELEDYRRARELCDRYADADIGFVDAAVLAVTERLNEPKLATLDHRHFSMLRPRHVEVLRLLPD